MASRLENACRGTHDVVERLILNDRSRGQRDAMRVLDLPCGEGAFTRRLVAAGVQVLPGDVVDILAPDLSGHAFANMDETLPFADRAFTDLVCIDGIEHIERQFDFVRECGRVLEDGGRLVISTPNISAARSRWRHLLTGHHNKCKTPLNERHVTPLHHKSMISFPELRYLLHSSGFRLEQVETNRVKTISWFYALLWPFSRLTTSRVYNTEEHDEGQRGRNREIGRQMHSLPVFYGETLIVVARKTG